MIALRMVTLVLHIFETQKNCQLLNKSVVLQAQSGDLELDGEDILIFFHANHAKLLLREHITYIFFYVSTISFSLQLLGEHDVLTTLIANAFLLE
jgi:hypothetical protein